MDELIKYFPELTELQRERFAAMGALYEEWNEKINVISRKDISNLYERHILHSLAIARFVTPAEGSMIIDFGSGGGFPGIPLAVVWPQCRFHLVDRVGKKLRVAMAVADGIGLDNVAVQHGDIGECKVKADYVVSRAVMRLDELVRLSRRLKAPQRKDNRLPNGLICLKGGELQSELDAVHQPKEVVPLAEYFSEEFFSTKQLVYVKL